MKKFKLIITVAVLAVISYSCNNSAVERMADKMQPEPVVIEQEGAGFFVNEPGEKFVAGSDDVMDVLSVCGLKYYQELKGEFKDD